MTTTRTARATHLPDPSATIRKDLMDAAVASMIDALGTPSFPQRYLASLHDVVGFDLSMIAIYDGARLVSCFADEQSPLSNERFLRSYSEATYRHNPFFQHTLRGLGTGIYRMADLARPTFIARPRRSNASLEIDGGEEIGFITAGWPRRLSELNIAVRASDRRMAQISLYRADRSPFDNDEMRRLTSVTLTLTSIFRRHLDEGSSAVRRSIEPPSRRDGRTGFDRLSKRERQVVELILAGRRASDISDMLEIGMETLRTHRKRAYAKLGVSTRLELMSRLLSDERNS